MKIWNAKTLREDIKKLFPEGMVVPRHTERGHFYEVIDGKFKIPPIYPSVTGKLQILKDESIVNFKMNRALEYIFANFTKMNEGNIMEHLDNASKVSGGILADAGDVGTRIHDLREVIFRQWIETGVMPEDFVKMIPEGEVDIRVTSAIRALQDFCVKEGYIPIACELLVYDHKFKVAGTLDDIGLIRKVIKEGDGSCLVVHDSMVESEKTGKNTCMKCGFQWKYEFVLMDLKSSNQFKDTYFFQVALYYWMFHKLTGIKPERCFILKVSKEDGRYKIEDLKKPNKLAEYTRYMLKTNEGIEFIKGLRKDNQKVVASTIQL